MAGGLKAQPLSAGSAEPEEAQEPKPGTVKGLSERAVPPFHLHELAVAAHQCGAHHEVLQRCVAHELRRQLCHSLVVADVEHLGACTGSQPGRAGLQPGRTRLQLGPSVVVAGMEHLEPLQPAQACG